MSKPDSDFQVNRQFLRFKDKDVVISLKNREEDEGKVIALDNYLNTVIETDNGIKFIKGTKIAFIALK
ncbi:LSM domain protein [Methanobacterium alkalithermotolerans]|uniref:LSM domain protein n=1 Tax=Methanobacterium alkalithermotolerans TaxID=2731220 RepID=A0A8T8K8H3_9EURY|nr:LSM domain protein [Methanobacterium alkalithermotolerans]QUH23413.1 LSM domain protein [Methanobacterium alkalithermotolerans]